MTRDAPSQEPKDILKDVVATAEKNVKEAADHIAKMLGLESAPSKDEVLDIIKVQYKTFADNAEKVGKEFEKEVSWLIFNWQAWKNAKIISYTDINF